MLRSESWTLEGRKEGRKEGRWQKDTSLLENNRLKLSGIVGGRSRGGGCFSGFALPVILSFFATNKSSGGGQGRLWGEVGAKRRRIIMADNESIRAVLKLCTKFGGRDKASFREYQYKLRVILSLHHNAAAEILQGLQRPARTIIGDDP